MASDLISIFALSLLAMFNPSLLAATTVMLLLPNPKRLLAGYLLGAFATSITLGLLIVHALHGSSLESTSKHHISPVEDIVLGLILLLLAYIVRTERDRPVRDRRRQRRETKVRAREEAGKSTESLTTRLLGRGDPRITFVVGALLSFPGVSYLDALDHIHKLNGGVVVSVLLVLYFCLMQQILIEVPLVMYIVAPDRAQRFVDGLKGWINRSGRRTTVIVATALGLLLILRGVITLL